MAQLERFCGKCERSSAVAETAIKELKDQMEQARTSETISYEEEIRRVKFD